MNSLRSKGLKLVFLAFVMAGLSFPTMLEAASAQSSTSTGPTGHGVTAKGTQTTVSTLSNGWITESRTFSSPDLMRTYGFSTMTWNATFYSGLAGSKTVTTSEKMTRFILRADETPLPLLFSAASSTTTSASANSTVAGAVVSSASGISDEATGQIFDPITSPMSSTQNGYVYPQFTLEKTTVCVIICIDFYSYSDPVNVAYEYQSLDSIVNYLTSQSSWASAGLLNCVGDQYIYDFSAGSPNYKIEDRQLVKGDTGCLTSGRFHARFWTMANGRVVVGAHHEHFDLGCLCHKIDGWDNAENQVFSDQSGLFPAIQRRADDYWLGNNVLPDGSSCCQGVSNDGYVSTITNTITVTSNPTTDTYLRSHGLAVDQTLPVPWWPPYQSGFEFLVTSTGFTYSRGVYLDKGSHYVQEAASGFVPNYAWYTTISFNGANVGSGYVGRNQILQAPFTI